jgi:predicted nucleic acid-binding protein
MSNSTVCVDASFVARLFLGTDDDRAWQLLTGWNEDGTVVWAPSLLVYELTNIFYRYHRAGYLSLATAELVLEAAIELPVRLESHETLTKNALRLASTLRLSATYDAYYLALADRLEAQLWTADARLHRMIGDQGLAVSLVS